jgi:hypothetical protein
LKDSDRIMPQNGPTNRVVAVRSAELTESLGPQAIDNIPMGHYVFLLEFNGARKFGFLRPKKKRADVVEQRLLVCVSHSN